MPLYEVFLAGLSVLAGGVAALAGFGIGSLLTPALAVALGTRLAVAVVSVPHLVATAYRLWLLRESIDRRVLLTFGLASAAGGLAGAVIHGFATSPLLSVVLGTLLIFAGASELTGFLRHVQLGGRMALGAGLLSGIFGGLVGNQGGIRSAALLRFDVSGQTLVATATATALLVDLARMPVYLVTTGVEVVEQWPIVVLLTVGVVVGTVAGAPILKRLPDPVFRRLLAVLLIVLGIALVLGIGG